ncbi:MAG TPA: hypothetical protein VJT31_30635, partial [Rugosimonospora sp.]|nr:hypothetical protein [Rugosimonospora sp.]
MTDERRTDDLDVIRGDDLLLDSLGRGEAAPSDDEVAVMLAVWRADLADEFDDVTLRPAALDGGDSATVPLPLPGSGGGDPPTAPVLPLRKRRLGRPRIAVAAALILVAFLGGLSVAAMNATPGSPLWPISQLLNPDRADVLAAENAIDQARQAVAQHRYADASRLVDRAQTLVDKVRSAPDRQRLQAELNTVLAALAGGLRGGAVTPGTPGPSATPAPTPTPGAGGTAGGGAPGS